MKSPFASKRFWLNMVATIAFTADQFKEFMPPEVSAKVLAGIAVANMLLGIFFPTPVKPLKF